MADSEIVAALQLDLSSRTQPGRNLVLKKVKGVRWVREKELGRGSFGVVWLEKGTSGEQRGVKEVDKKYLPSDFDYKRELLAMARLSKYIGLFVEVQGWWETHETLCIAMEYFPYGTLHDCLHLVKEKDAKQVVRQVLRGLCHMHAADFVHRDLKPENIFVLSMGQEWRVKIGDFGLTKSIENSTNARTRVGTLLYQAPEILGWIDEDLDDYTEAVDMWSMGCLTYALLAHRPMSEKEVKQYSKRMRRLPTQLLSANRVSDQAISFVQTLLIPEPTGRLSAHMALQEPWLKQSSSFGHPELSIFSSSEDEKALKWLYVAGFGSPVKSLSGPEAFYWSVASGHRFIMEFLLRNGVDVNEIDSPETQRTALHLAAKDGDWRAMRYMIGLGAWLTAHNRQGWRALHFAAHHGRDEAIIFLIRKMEGDPDYQTAFSKKTALHLAASAGHVSVVRALLLEHADCNAKCNNKLTPLHYASLAGHYMVAQELIRSGAHVNAQCSRKMSPLRYAVNHNQRQIIELLLGHGANIKLKDTDGVSPLEHAQILGDRPTKKLLAANKAQMAKAARERTVKETKAESKPFRQALFTVQSPLGFFRKPKITQLVPAVAPKTNLLENEPQAAPRKDNRLATENADPTIYYLADESSEETRNPGVQHLGEHAPHLRAVDYQNREWIPRKRDPRRDFTLDVAPMRFLSRRLPFLSRFTPGVVQEQQIRSNISLPLAEEIQSLDEKSANQHILTFKSSIFGILSPRPRVVYGQASEDNDGRGKTAQIKAEGRAFWNQPVGELADEMDSSALRLMMERQDRRDMLRAQEKVIRALERG